MPIFRRPILTALIGLFLIVPQGDSTARALRRARKVRMRHLRVSNPTAWREQP